MRHSKRTALLLGLALAIAGSVDAQVRYVDRSGVAHWVSRPDEVPEEYRGNIRTPELPTLPRPAAAEEIHVARRALRPLRELVALVSTPATYQEYREAVANAQAAFNSAGLGSLSLGRSAHEAMSVYLVAAEAWAAVMRHEYGKANEVAHTAPCGFSPGEDLGGGVMRLLSCAGDKVQRFEAAIAHAERQLANKKQK